MQHKFKLTTDEPLQITPDQRGEQGSVLVTPSDVQDHIVLESIDSISVAAINPHKALSWYEGHVSTTTDGRALENTVVRHNGAHVIRGFVPVLVIAKVANVVISHKLDGTVPIAIQENKLILHLQVHKYIK